MKMLLLDVEHREVKLVEANGLNDYYNLIACDYVDIIHRRIGDVEVEIVLDDEGALVDKPKSASVSSVSSPSSVTLPLATSKLP